MPNNKNKNESTVHQSEGRLIAADFFTYTLKAFLIGVATSAVLGGAVVLLAQTSAQDDATPTSEHQEIRETP